MFIIPLVRAHWVSDSGGSLLEHFLKLRQTKDILCEPAHFKGSLLVQLAANCSNI